MANAPVARLYDIQSDPAETTNLYKQHPEAAGRLLAQLKSDVNRGRSTEGAESKNDVSRVVLWKSEKNQNVDCRFPCKQRFPTACGTVRLS